MAQRRPIEPMASHLQQPPAAVAMPSDARIEPNDIGARAQRGEQLGPDEMKIGMMPFLPEGAAQPVFDYLKSLGKPISELLNTIFTTKGGGLPSRLRLTNFDARTGNILLHGVTKGEPFEVLPQDLDKLIDAGVVDVEQPAARGVASTEKKLRELLQFDAVKTDPRNRTLGLPVQTKTPMRRTLDTLPKTLKK